MAFGACHTGNLMSRNQAITSTWIYVSKSENHERNLKVLDVVGQSSVPTSVVFHVLYTERVTVKKMDKSYNASKQSIVKYII
jgi:hypothetical protein